MEAVSFQQEGLLQRQFKLLQPLEFDILAKLERLRKNKTCENVYAGYNDFASRRFRYRKGPLKTHKGAMSLAGHGDGVEVNSSLAVAVIFPCSQQISVLHLCAHGIFLQHQF